MCGRYYLTAAPRDLAALFFHEGALLLVCGFDVAHGGRRSRRQLVGLRAADDPATDGACFRNRAPDQLLGGGPVEAHPALSGVHGFRHSEPVAPDVAAEGERGLPVDRGRRDGADIGERVGHHVHGRVRDSRAAGGAAAGIHELALDGVVVHGAVRTRQTDQLTQRQMSSALRMAAISSSVQPSSARTSSVCSPSSGGDRLSVASPEL